MVVAKTANSRGEAKKSIRSKISYHTKKHDIGSKRKLSRFGKRQRVGHTGLVTQYISRTKAIKNLQITLKDFRRLCILKGVYPRDPLKRPAGKRSTTYYHAKDIAFLHHEPILGKFREMKAVTKKIARRLGRNELSEARRVFANRPKYTLDHVVRERYPTFLAALGDLDDGLTLVNLFANLPVNLATSDHGPRCARLAREWQFFVAKSKTLRKAFVSIKGIYYQAEVRGVPLTWLVPHKFSQDVQRLEENKQIDFRVMRTFLEFYETLMEFVMFKLYAEELKSSYPPTLLAQADQAGGFLKALRANALVQSSAQSAQSAVVVAAEPITKKKTVVTGTSLEKKLSKIASLAKKEKDQDEDEDVNEDDDVMNNDDFAQDENVKALKGHQEESERAVNLFRGMRVFLSREVPLEPLEFCIESFGGHVLRSDLGDVEADVSITHFVTDRPSVSPEGDVLRKEIAGREYVQPQWIFDCVNSRLVLPLAEYHPSVKALPPHLSPFVDDEATGYVPTRAEEIEELRRARAGDGGTESLLRATGTLTKDDDEEDEDSSELEDSEEDEEEIPEINDRAPPATASAGASKQRDNVREIRQVEEEEEEEEEMVAPPPKVGSEAFIASPTFAGPKDGFYFRRGSRGLGYYRDASAALPKFDTKKETKQADKQKRVAESTEAKEMRTIVMSKKARNLYDRMQHGIAQKNAVVQKLEEKRDVLEKQKRRT